MGSSGRETGNSSETEIWTSDETEILMEFAHQQMRYLLTWLAF